MSEAHQNRRLNLASFALVALLVSVGLLIRYLIPQTEKTSNEHAVVPPESAHVPGAVTRPEPATTQHPSAVEFANKLTQKTESPEEDLLVVQQLLLLYHRSLGENPEGDNEDVVAALLGQNKHRLTFLPERVDSIRDGLLLDRWGTPYFMHPESASHMSLRSAGPDKHLFTDDDVVLE